jgi:hypothetical protein
MILKAAEALAHRQIVDHPAQAGQAVVDPARARIGSRSP